MMNFQNIWPLKMRSIEPEFWPDPEHWQKLRRRTKQHLRGLGWAVDENVSWVTKIAVRAEKAHSYVHLTFHNASEMSLKTCLRDFSEVDRRYGSIPHVAWGVFTSQEPSADLIAEACSQGMFFVTRRNMHDIEALIKTTIELRKKQKDRVSLQLGEHVAANSTSAIKDSKIFSGVSTNVSQSLDSSLDKRTVDAGQPMKGFVEIIQPTKVTGWAADPDAWDEHVWVTVLDNGVVVGEGRADMFRPDLQRAGVGNGDHGYAIPVTMRLPAGGRFTTEVTAKSSSGKMRALQRLKNALPQMDDTSPALSSGDQSDASGAAAQNPEAVRLVIWDLDDTFWKGTVTEGGIESYVQEHHDIVVSLAKRGIISSICSKNDPAVINPILEKFGIAEFFVFPCISWEPKGKRLQALIDRVQLRPSTVMFVDDNPGNRAEARDRVPGLQVEDEHFIARMLDDPRFAGKDDKDLTRLAQYKLLEARHNDEQQTEGSNEDFLRTCEITVRIEYDVASHLDRAIELINRTNQLNFTKRRLPEDIQDARSALLEEIRPYARQCGLVQVKDRYGDYGFVGFFSMEGARREHVPGRSNRTLRHFCFSCRTLGMLVEQWLYNYLGQPDLHVNGDVLTDLSITRVIDWITLVSDFSSVAGVQDRIAPEIRVYGGCEANAIGVYLGAYTGEVNVTGNFNAGSLFVRVNGASLALSALSRSREEFAEEAAAMGLPADLMVCELFSAAPYGTAFVLSCGKDAGGGGRYRHRATGWEISIGPNGVAVDFTKIASTDELISQVQPHLRSDKEGLAQIVRAYEHIRANYQSLEGFSDSERRSNMRSLIEMVPVGSKLVILLDDPRERGSDNVVRFRPSVDRYNQLLRSLIEEYPFVQTVSFENFVQNEERIQIGGNHYARLVYLEMSREIAATLATLPARVHVN